MLKISTERKGNPTVIRLSGEITETASFEDAVQEPFSQLEVKCGDVIRINSVGIRIWIKYFQKLRARGIKVSLLECSTYIVEQINMVSNFAEQMDIVSIFVPFTCRKCTTNFNALFRTMDLKKLDTEKLLQKCPKCEAPSGVDDIPEDYFGFLAR